MQKGLFNRKAVKMMKALGVDEAAEQAYEREKNAGCPANSTNWTNWRPCWPSAARRPMSGPGAHIYRKREPPCLFKSP